MLCIFFVECCELVINNVRIKNIKESKTGKVRVT